jgi:hypothetical protein
MRKEKRVQAARTSFQQFTRENIVLVGHGTEEASVTTRNPSFLGALVNHLQGKDPALLPLRAVSAISIAR